MTTSVPEIDLSDPQVHRDPATAYGRARERSPLARLRTPGMGPMWAVLRYHDAKAMLGDPRFEFNPGSRGSGPPRGTRRRPDLGPDPGPDRGR